MWRGCTTTNCRECVGNASASFFNPTTSSRNSRSLKIFRCRSFIRALICRRPTHAAWNSRSWSGWATGYIIAYAGRNSRAGEADRMAKRAANYLTTTRGINRDRIVTVVELQRFIEREHGAEALAALR